MRGLVLVMLALLLISIAGAEEYALDEEATIPTNGLTYVNLTLPPGLCVEAAQLNITTSEQVRINVTRYDNDGVLLIDDAFELNFTTSTDYVFWDNASGVSLCEGAECLPLVTEINRRLVACNNEEPVPTSCRVVFSPTAITNPADVTFSDSFFSTKTGYTGIITIPDGDGGFVDGGNGFSCDNLYVCGNGQLDPGEDCDIGQDSLVVTTTESSPTMAECDFERSDAFTIDPVFEANPNPQCPSDPTYDNFVTRRTAALAATDYFAELYLSISSGNQLGLVDYHVQVPSGQLQPVTGDYQLLRGEIEQNIGLANSGPCFACAIQASFELLQDANPSLSTKQTIVLMGDAAAVGCFNVAQGNHDADCSSYPNGASEAERARNQAMDLACDLFESEGITIYTVGYGANADTATLENISEGCTDGLHFDASNIDVLLQAYEDIAFASAAECTDTCEYFVPETPVCGDADVNLGEECDDGSFNGVECTPSDTSLCYWCSDQCTVENNSQPPNPNVECGNAIPELGEQCDRGDGNRDPALGCPNNEYPCKVCSPSCNEVTLNGPTQAVCGNGINETNEECDAGSNNKLSCDASEGDCNFCEIGTCLYIENGTTPPTGGGICGDSVTQSPNSVGFFEECDDGLENTETACVPAVGAVCNYCDTSCERQFVRDPFSPFSYCGDGTPNTEIPNDEGLGGPNNDGYEECDNGGNNRDTCDPTVAGNEQCTICTTNCEIFVNQTDPINEDNDPFCGDGNVSTYTLGDGTVISEECDDGEDVNTDSCTAPPNGRCNYCSLSCTRESSDNPFGGECLDFTAERLERSLNLNPYASSTSFYDLDLLWDIEYDSTAVDGDSDLNPDVVSNNVLVAQPSDTFEEGRLILNVTDGTTSAKICVNVYQDTALYGDTPPPDTRLLVREGRLVSGYVEEPLTGDIKDWGPYRISMEVWQR